MLDAVEQFIDNSQYDEALDSLHKAVYRNDINGLTEQKNILAKVCDYANKHNHSLFVHALRRRFYNVLSRELPRDN